MSPLTPSTDTAQLKSKSKADAALAAQQALGVFFNIAKAWDLSNSEQQTLLGISKSTLRAWKAGTVPAALRNDTRERLSYIFRIYAALGALFTIPERAYAWIKVTNSAPLFGGVRALDRMLGGLIGDLKMVADYLEAQRGGDFA